jgi:tagatose 1,6-diphosphate aldolase
VFFDRFHFHDPGPLIDGELELVPPNETLIDDVLAGCAHPLTQLEAPDEAAISREQLQAFVQNAPGGRESARNSVRGVPQYHFWMRIRHEFAGTPGIPPIPIVGTIGLRIGSTPSIEQYYGHVGYHVFPIARGRRYAFRACRLLLPLARHHGFKNLCLTCNPNNMASRRTCELLGARLVDIIPVPQDEPLFARGDTQKCRYRLDLRPTP